MLQLRDDALQILFARDPKEVASCPLDMAGVKHHGRLLGNDAAKNAFPLVQGQRSHVAAIEPQHVENVISCRFEPPQQVAELRSTVLIQAHDFTIENCAAFQADMDGGAEACKALIRIPLSRYEPGLVLVDVRERAEAVHLQLEYKSL